MSNKSLRARIAQTLKEKEVSKKRASRKKVAAMHQKGAVMSLVEVWPK